MKLLGLSGKAGSGKDTTAAVLLNLYGEYGAERRAFADALKEDIFSLLVSVHGGWEEKYFQYAKERAAWHGTHTRLDFINDFKHIPEIRALLQSYGAAQRLGNPLHWVERLFDWADTNEGGRIKALVIPDVRYRNEADAIIGRGGQVWRVHRPGYWNGLTAEARQHPSETELDAYESFTGYIYNEGGTHRLRQQCQGNALERFLRTAG